MMVAPEREVPGIIAKHWKRPIPTATFIGSPSGSPVSAMIPPNPWAIRS